MEAEEKKPESPEPAAAEAAEAAAPEAPEASEAAAGGSVPGAEAPEAPSSPEEAAPDAADAAAGSSVPGAEAPGSLDWKNMYARLLADFDNFKKRTARDREDTYRFAEADILSDVLPAVDNLALALDKAEDKENAFVKGVALVYDSLLKALKEHGAEPFDSVGQELDTEKMEAIATLPSADIDEGKVSNEVKKGWMLKGKVLRAAQVVVSSGKAENG